MVLSTALETEYRLVHEYKTEVTELLSKAREVTEKVGIAEHAAHFKDESNEHKRAAICWLIITVFLAAGTALLGWMNYGRTFSLLEGSGSTGSGNSPSSLATGALDFFNPVLGCIVGRKNL